MASAPQLIRLFSGNAVELRPSGAWIAANAGALEALTDAAALELRQSASLRINMAGVAEIDTLGAWLLEKLTRQMTSRDRHVDVVGVSEKDEGLIAEIREVNRSVPLAVERPGLVADKLEHVGRAAWKAAEDIAVFLQMLGALCSALLSVFRRPRSLRLTSLTYQLYKVGWQAIPIVLLITFLIGAIIAQQGFFHFRRFGADLYIVDMIGFLIMREMGLLLTAIVVAGRSGSSFTAELGSMKMREEIDALKTMGFDPVEVLILPRVLVLVLALPVLTFLGSMAALAGAGLIAVTYAGMAPTLFLDRLHEAITIDHFLVGMIKAPFMGLVIGLISCVEGLRVLGSTTSLGTHTTQSVVKSIFMIIVLDGLFALFFSAIRM